MIDFGFGISSQHNEYSGYDQPGRARRTKRYIHWIWTKSSKNCMRYSRTQFSTIRLKIRCDIFCQVKHFGSVTAWWFQIVVFILHWFESYRRARPLKMREWRFVAESGITVLPDGKGLLRWAHWPTEVTFRMANILRFSPFEILSRCL